MVMGHVGHESTVGWVAWVMGHERRPISISALPDSLAVFKGLTSKGSEEKGTDEEEEKGS